jgi:hypothetical protein
MAFWAPTLRRICELAFFSSHEGHINFLKLLVGAAVPSSPSVAKGSNQGAISFEIMNDASQTSAKDIAIHAAKMAHISSGVL